MDTVTVKISSPDLQWTILYMVRMTTPLQVVFTDWCDRCSVSLDKTTFFYKKRVVWNSDTVRTLGVSEGKVITIFASTSGYEGFLDQTLPGVPNRNNQT